MTIVKRIHNAYMPTLFKHPPPQFVVTRISLYYIFLSHVDRQDTNTRIAAYEYTSSVAIVFVPFKRIHSLMVVTPYSANVTSFIKQVVILVEQIKLKLWFHLNLLFSTEIRLQMVRCDFVACWTDIYSSPTH